MRCLLLALLAVGAALALELHRERWGGMFDSYTSRGDAGLTVLVVCGIHGRELITQQLCERWLEELDGMPERDDGVEPPRIIMVPAYNEAGLAIAGGGMPHPLLTPACGRRPPALRMLAPLGAPNHLTQAAGEVTGCASTSTATGRTCPSAACRLPTPWTRPGAALRR